LRRCLLFPPFIGQAVSFSNVSVGAVII
jgi:hypothetical protein